jgi:hypothetical protein
MKKSAFLLIAAVLLAGAGCTATTGADVNNDGLQVDGGIDLGE